YERVADAGESIGHVGDSGAGQRRAVGGERHSAGAADVGPEPGVVLVQYLGIQFADGLASAQVPVLDDPLQVARHKPPAHRVERNVVDVAPVHYEHTNGLAVDDRPELDEMVIAARCDGLAVRAHGDGSDPAVVGREIAGR